MAPPAPMYVPYDVGIVKSRIFFPSGFLALPNKWSDASKFSPSIFS